MFKFFKLNNKKTLKYENCVSCGKETKTLISTDINFRKNYIHGVGEVCEDCRCKLMRDRFWSA